MHCKTHCHRMLFNARSWDGFKKQQEKFMEEKTIKIKLLAQEAADLQIAGSWEDTQTWCCFYLFLSICYWALPRGHWLELTFALTLSALPHVTFWRNGTILGGLWLPWTFCVTVSQPSDSAMTWAEAFEISGDCFAHCMKGVTIMGKR